MAPKHIDIARGTSQKIQHNVLQPLPGQAEETVVPQRYRLHCSDAIELSRIFSQVSGSDLRPDRCAGMPILPVTCAPFAVLHLETWGLVIAACTACMEVVQPHRYRVAYRSKSLRSLHLLYTALVITHGISQGLKKKTLIS